ncbi:sensor histidine kinase [Rhizorhapis suberifaciens]|uniref:histidine kinase n=1 Tax=Rhizorhapis suberifaciens TaxID=13656 RepID=A0A840HXL7_9SPHN|nr:HAMP domain-containing sensor histidine kinase [Rhizorhapis suberifaciens]MBB4642299.1 signal transduction histidine kinase [Rhizorhapis suberifaciens]
MRFNDQLHTILAAKPPGAGGAVTRWRQCVDILAQYDRPSRGGMSDADREAILEELEALRDKVNERQRISTVVDIGTRLRSPALVRFFGTDRPSICAAAMVRAQLPDGIWAEMIKEISPTARGVLRHREDMGPLAKRALASFGSHDLVLTTSVPAVEEQKQEAPAQAPSAGVDESQIRRLVDRIERFTSGRELAPSLADDIAEVDEEASQPVPISDPEVREFSFETDVDGVIHWVKGAARGQLIGMSISQPPPFANAGPDGHVAGAFRHRTAFRNARFTIEAGRLAGEWRMSAIPYFHQQTGRFLGYRGNARRPHLHEVTGGIPGGFYGSSMRTDSLRELIHELRTPLNAILGFAEIIDHQLFGPVSSQYRALAQDIVNDAQQLLGTFDDLDLATRIERGDLATQSGAVDPAELVLGLAARFSDHGAAGRLDISAAEHLPPLRLDRIEAERMFQHLLRIVLSVAGPGEQIRGQCWYNAGHPYHAIVFDIDRPAALRGLEETEMFDSGYGPDGEWPDAPLLGIGFSLRLVRNLARSGGGNFHIEDDHFTLVLPALVEAGESGTGG